MFDITKQYLASIAHQGTSFVNGNIMTSYDNNGNSSTSFVNKAGKDCETVTTYHPDGTSTTAFINGNMITKY